MLYWFHMKKLIAVTGILSLLGAGCVLFPEPSREEGADAVDDVEEGEEVVPVELDVTLPIVAGPVGYLPVYKRFGEYFDVPTRGYHVGEDAEVPLEDGDAEAIPVFAVADGPVVYLSRTSEYGGVIALQHEFDGESVQTLYAYLDLDSTTLRTGDVVTKGQVLANLGAANSDAAGGGRQHLFFAVYTGSEVRLQETVASAAELDAWINPQDFFAEHGLTFPDPALADPGGWIAARALWYPVPPRTDVALAHTKFAELDFQIPNTWDVEYIPSLDALNLYVTTGEGTARERSQILVRYFDASDFQTLSTVNVISTETTTVGADAYDARRYEIIKKSGVADLADQPLWRNAQHVVTDFRAEEGFTRFYVVASNPDLDATVYQHVLDTMDVIE